MTSVGVEIVVRFAHPAVQAIAPIRAVLNVTTPALRAVHKRPLSAAHVITRVRAAATRRVLRNVRRAAAVVAPMAAQESVRLPVPTAARLRRNKAVADVVKNVQVAVTPPVLLAVVVGAHERVVAHAALTV